MLSLSSCLVFIFMYESDDLYYDKYYYLFPVYIGNLQFNFERNDLKYTDWLRLGQSQTI